MQKYERKSSLRRRLWFGCEEMNVPSECPDKFSSMSQTVCPGCVMTHHYPSDFSPGARAGLFLKHLVGADSAAVMWMPAKLPSCGILLVPVVLQNANNPSFSLSLPTAATVCCAEHWGLVLKAMFWWQFLTQDREIVAICCWDFRWILFHIIINK